MALPNFEKDSDSLIPQEYILELGRSMQTFLKNKVPTYLEAGIFDGIEHFNTLILNYKLG